MHQLLLAGFIGVAMTMWFHPTIASQPATDYDPCLKATNQNSTEKHNLGNQCKASADNDSSTVVLPPAALRKLKIDAGFGWGIFNGSIYNGNNDYAIEQIIIKLIPSQIAGTTTNIPLETKEYAIDVTVPPLSKGALSMFLNSDGTQEFEWHLINALGRKIAVNQ